MIPKTEECKVAMSDIRELITATKRRGTHKGYINCSGCSFVTGEFISILENAGWVAEHGGHVFGYAVAACHEAERGRAVRRP